MSRRADGDRDNQTPNTRDARKENGELRRAGAHLVGLAKLHVLWTMRRTGRCLPWRSGRTVKDLERRSGLAGPPSPTRAPLLAPLLELLAEDGLVHRRAGHYRLRSGCALRCPACGDSRFEEHPASAPVAEPAPVRIVEFLCSSCGAWSGMRAAADEAETSPSATGPQP